MATAAINRINNFRVSLSTTIIIFCLHSFLVQTLFHLRNPLQHKNKHKECPKHCIRTKLYINIHKRWLDSGDRKFFSIYIRIIRNIFVIYETPCNPFKQFLWFICFCPSWHFILNKHLFVVAPFCDYMRIA